MTRLIVVSFCILGFIFFEMSGGTDFDPEATRLSRIEAPVLIEEEKLGAVLTEASQPKNERVTRVAVNLTSVSEVLPSKSASDSGMKADSTPAIKNAAEPIDEKPAVVFTGLLGDNTNFPIMDLGTSIPKPKDASVSIDPGETGITDIRQVTGNRVNVRGGPGTEYSVVDSLTRGQKVEVLQDLGNGWVQLRLIDGDPIGWMADFLLSEG